ncbi:MAG TPA: RNA methyltransferase [Thermoanaerobaculia bacterium]|nr:RNA methyltransferase [Thermoanaerobaculia bacterium]
MKDIRRLRRSKGDLALLEGPHLVGEAAAAGVELTELLATPEFLASAEGRALAARLPHPVEPVDADVLASVLDADSPRGVAAVARLPRSGIGTLPRRPGGVYVYAEGLQDPGNLGALARSAEAAGAAGLALAPGSAHPNHPRALRASAGSLLRLPAALGAAPQELAVHLAPLAPRWLALVPRHGESLYGADLSGALILALGAEGPGLSAALEARADLRLTIPVAAPVESLNATVAASLVLFEIRRRRLAATPEATGADPGSGPGFG